jgi:N-acetylmuramoyl-L-alanine amidase
MGDWQLELLSLSRPVNKLIIHCSATPPSMDVGVYEIKKWHTDKKPRGNGWSDIGYHWVIRRDGTIEDGRDVNKIGAHTKGYNTGSLGLCLVGGVNGVNDADANFTDKQWHSLELMARGIKAMIPHITIHGHNEYANKSCPSFSVQTWVKSKKL